MEKFQNIVPLAGTALLMKQQAYVQKPDVRNLFSMGLVQVFTMDYAS